MAQKSTAAGRRRATQFLAGAALSSMILAGGSIQAADTQAGWKTLVDGKSLKNTRAFTRSWGYNYPWGDTHNGSAKMSPSNISLSDGVATVQAVPVSDQGKFHYSSETFYLKKWVTIDAARPKWDISIEAKVPTVKGTWPAFWLTGVKGWPPESDIMEFKGDSTVWQNTYNGKWDNTLTNVPTAGDWHKYRLVAEMTSADTVDFHYYIDNDLKATHTQTGFIGQPLWLLFDYQTEGSSGSPGPTDTTYTYLRNPTILYQTK